MANWCENMVRFTGDENAVSAVRAFFTELQKQNENPLIELPGYITAENRAMTDIWVRPDFLYFQTRWHPNLEALIQIADHHGVGFTSRYAEPDTNIWGEMTYADGHGENIHLTWEDHPASNHFEGEDYEDIHGLMQAVLDAKIRQHRLEHLPGR